MLKFVIICDILFKLEVVMASYKVKDFKFYLSNDKKFIEKLHQSQDDLVAGRVGFFVSMQTLIGYTSFKFLNSLI